MLVSGGPPVEVCGGEWHSGGELGCEQVRGGPLGQPQCGVWSSGPACSELGVEEISGYVGGA